MQVFLVNKESKAAYSLAVKLSGEKSDGEMVMCTSEEIEVLKSGDIQMISNINEKADCQVIQIDIHNDYLFIVNSAVVINDVLRAIEGIKGFTRIIRTKN